ncbi:sensor domain-containing protein [Mycolicibacterium elephantis]|uniref:Sensor domain-containing protein n=1 Tax=Mycolicibacterium elephantis TaxID=81858 RepID=A0A0M2ZHA2_9MYCO|nr:sensor domain-containing protein [Mycolicibacterium elephantis]KKW64872.1 pknH-like domain protein [Mycolicibacterium elephantis]ORA62842.1 sensor domain-containing protein [Mycolicibacterium elephantis]
MGARAAVLSAGLALVACTRVTDAPQPQPVAPVAPITAGQIGDLLSDKVDDTDGNLFATVEPEECSGVATEVDPPFLVDFDPAATDGGHWTVHDGSPVYVEELVAVYRADYSAQDALSQARHTLERCRDTAVTVTDMNGRTYRFGLLPGETSGSPDILLWSFEATDWACDNALVAAHNAAVEIATCGAAGGLEVAALAQDALDRIDTLANTTA